MTYYLGIDGGGSKTLAVVTDGAGHVLGRGVSGCGNHQLGAELADGSIRAAIQAAMEQANVNHEDIRFTAFGLAGADREADFHILRPMIAAMGFEHHHIVCDTVIGLRAGTKQPDGVVIICGSGTNCYGVNALGEEMQCGGFGYSFGDFGGGADLAVEAFRAVIRAWDGREKSTALTGPMLHMLGFETVEEMFHAYLDDYKRAPHTLAKLLFEVADSDEAARKILQRQGTELGISASAVIRRLNMGNDKFDLVMVGSVLTRGDSRFIAPYIEEQVKAVAPNCTLRVLQMEPVAGALLLAMEKSGQRVEAAVYDNLNADLAVKERNAEWALD
ncbi:N-acetylglucosamine kinase [Paenibacillus harenae]|uniref:N-acetylglucosamine kinase-like BadF-type ATPase n=1 Tax=Paenibacillus harenae TaxID=306543 RepID=A0ABT9TZJ2_PAEHA|nr:BadF/BadG/BcrA/BcrD ATPase family protein [Paenibacillus harenae]MDQ0112805.1 N-acetylglucosamine kinase-like BadF-type ATPase [Paenibacillus harenae]